MRIIIFFILMASSLFAADLCKADGWVYDAVTKMPIHGVNVLIRGTSIGVATDDKGYFKLDLSSGDEYLIVFTALGYKKEIKMLALDKPKEVEYRIYLKPEPVELDEIVVRGNKSFEDMRGFLIDGSEFERLGEDDMEKALVYFLPDVVSPLKDRLKVASILPTLNAKEGARRYLEHLSGNSDFTLYVDKEWKDTMYLDQIDPYSIKYVQVWNAVGEVNGTELMKKDLSPVGLDARTGGCVVHIVTK